MNERIFRQRQRIGSPKDCWIWAGSRFATGRRYGRFFIAGKSVLAHRVAYELAAGPIPAGVEVHHTCENPVCVNPAHLMLVTPKEHRNLERPYRYTPISRCPRGHEYHKTPGGKRCAVCHRIKMRERYYLDKGLLVPEQISKTGRKRVYGIDGAAAARR